MVAEMVVDSQCGLSKELENHDERLAVAVERLVLKV
jgi:hypothetical protein